MDYRNNKNKDPWDEGVFGTGNTMPPKSHSGIIALLLILVIFLSGIVSLLSFMNIKLFHQLSEQTKQMESISPMSFSDLDEPFSTTEPAEAVPQRPMEPDISLNLHRSPQSVENVPEPGALPLQEIYEKNVPSLVSVVNATDAGSITGSGVVVSDRGYILTTWQVVNGAETITLTLHDGTNVSALLIGADALTDLAVLYVDAPGLTAAQFGDSGSLRVGDTVAALGAQMNGSLRDGIISAINRDVSFLGQSLPLIQSSIPLSPENAGGPLVNCYGQIIGITTAGLMEAAEDGGSFAIPSTTVKQIVDQLMAQGYVSGRPTLGITGETITEFDQYYFHIPAGLYISGVDHTSDAYLRDIEPGDILISIDGIPVYDQLSLDTIVYTHAIGDMVTVVLFREGQEQTVTLTVTEYDG